MQTTITKPLPATIPRVLTKGWVNAAGVSFPDKLRPLVDKIGGATKAGGVIGYPRQTVNRWLRGEGQPAALAQVGVLRVLQLNIQSVLRRERKAKRKEAVS